MTGGGDAHQGLLVSGRFSGARGRALRARRSSSSATTPLAPVTVVVGSAAVRTRVGDLVVRRLGAVANLNVATLGRLAADLVAAEQGAPPVGARGPRPRAARAAPRRSSWPASSRTSGPVVDRPHFAQALAATLTDLREACVPPDSAWSDAVAAPRRAGRRAAPRRATSTASTARSVAELEARRLLDGAGVQLAAAAAAAAQRRCPGAVVLYGVYDLNQAQEALVRALIVERGATCSCPCPPAARAAALTDARRGRRARARGAAGSRPPRRHRDRRASARGLARRRRRRAPRARRATARSPWSPSPTSAPSCARRCAPSSAPSRAGRPPGTARWSCRTATRSSSPRRRSARPVCRVGVPRAGQVGGRAAAGRGSPTVSRRRPASRSRGARSSTCSPPGRCATAARPARPRCGWTRPGRPAWWPGPSSGPARLASRRRGLERRLADLEARGARRGRRRGRGLRQDRGGAAAPGGAARACRPRRPRSSAPAAGRRSAPPGATGRSSSPAPSPRCSTPRPPRRRATPPRACRRSPCWTRRSTSPRRRPCCASCWRPRASRAAASGRDGVAVLTPLELRGLSFHTVVFTGLAEGGFPARGRPDPLLGDAERRRVGAALGVRLPLAEQRDAESLLLFAFACEAARERLVLLAPRSGAADGRPRLPSRLLLRLASRGGRPAGRARRVPRAASRSGRCGAGSPARRRSRTTRSGSTSASATPPCCSRSRSPDARGAARRYAAAVLGDAAAAAAPLRRLALGAEARCRAPGTACSAPAPAPRSRPRIPSTPRCTPRASSATSAARSPSCCATCSGWRRPTSPATRSRWTPGSSARWRTTSCSAPTSRSSTATCAGTAPWRPCVAAWETCCAEAESRGITGAALSWEVRRELLLEDLLETVRRDPVFADPASRPVGVEWRFGEAVDRPVVARAADGRPLGALRRPSRPRRRDAAPGPAIIDYKSGGGGTERNRIKERLSVQLPVYRLALRQAGGRATTRPSPACTGSSRAAAASRTSTCRRREEASARRLQRARRRARSPSSTPACSRAPRASAASTATSRYACGVSGVGEGAQARARAARPGRAGCSRRPPRRTRMVLSAASATRTSATGSPPTSARPSCSRPGPAPARPACSSTAT